MAKKIEIDIAGICSVIHNCDGCTGKSKHCCASYDITISKKDLFNIVGCIPMASRFCSHLKSDGGYRNIFEQVESDLFSIDSDENNLCSFAFRKGKKILCALHTISSIHTIPLQRIKPLACLLWPLAICRTRTRILTIHDDAFDFDCNTPNDSGEMSLCPSIARSIDLVFGDEFRLEIEKAVQKGLPWIKIPFTGSLAGI